MHCKLANNTQVTKMSLVYGCVAAILIAISLAIAHTALLSLSPLDNPLPVILPSPPPASGAFSPNFLLLGTTKIGQHLLPQPEDVAVDSLGQIYVSCADGWIKRIDPSTHLVQNWTLIDGGRPVGLAIGLHDELLVCEPAMVPPNSSTSSCN